MEPTQQFQPKKPPIIQVTTDYDQFKILDYNRPINHLAKMSKSLARSNKLYVHPIIVNKDMEIIDGQHRWSYAQATQQPLYYVIDENFHPADLIAHNVTASNWVARDYAYFYSSCECKEFPVEQRRNYGLCLQICEEFKVAYDVFIKLFHMSKGNVSSSLDFKNGELRLKLPKEEIFSVMLQLEEIVNYLLKFKLVKKVNIEMYHAFYHLIRLEGYDRERMFKKLEDNLDVVLNILKFRRTDEIFNRILEVYNKNAKNRLESPRQK